MIMRAIAAIIIRDAEKRRANATRSESTAGQRPHWAAVELNADRKRRYTALRTVRVKRNKREQRDMFMALT